MMIEQDRFVRANVPKAHWTAILADDQASRFTRGIFSTVANASIADSVVTRTQVMTKILRYGSES